MENYRGPTTVLVVDDEAQACKWFARLFGAEFSILTATSVDQALATLSECGSEIAVVLTDYNMPGRDGIELLSILREQYPHITRLLISAFADKDVAMAAVNRGQVEHILEKPLDQALVRIVLRDALITGRQRANEQMILASKSSVLRDTLGFLAHEATAPLATVRGYLAAMKERHLGGPTGPVSGIQQRPGELLSMIEAAQRGADFAQSLVATFLLSSGGGTEAEIPTNFKASELVTAVRSKYPFDENEALWFSCEIASDFDLPGARDLLYLVLCTLIKNSILALRSNCPPHPKMDLFVDRRSRLPGLPLQPVIGVRDNGPGISPEILSRLTHEPVTTRAQKGGSGMGLIFCQRVMSMLGGTMVVQSEPEPDHGATVLLFFPPEPEATPLN